jgi:hypothetical protein
VSTNIVTWRTSVRDSFSQHAKPKTVKPGRARSNRALPGIRPLNEGCRGRERHAGLNTKAGGRSRAGGCGRRGLALVVVPTVSTVLTQPTGLGLSKSSYGGLFVPQSILAIVFSLGGATLTRRVGARTTLLLGFGANAVAMGLLALSVPLAFDHRLAYIDLLCATSFLGVGFAIVTPTLNVLAGKLESGSPDRAVLIGQRLARGFGGGRADVAYRLRRPGLLVGPAAVLLALELSLIIVAMRIPFDRGASPSSGTTQFPARLWVFAGFALAYALRAAQRLVSAALPDAAAGGRLLPTAVRPSSSLRGARNVTGPR